jgi:Fuc2NAc and GlcNAc transferase
MGDAGSTFLGAAISLSLLQPNLTATENWTALAITAPSSSTPSTPSAAACSTKKTRSHLYQRLQQTGLAHSTVSLIYLALTGFTALLILSLQQWGAIISVVTTIVLIPVAEQYLQKQTYTSAEVKISK